MTHCVWVRYMLHANFSPPGSSIILVFSEQTLLQNVGELSSSVMWSIGCYFYQYLAISHMWSINCNIADDLTVNTVTVCSSRSILLSLCLSFLWLFFSVRMWMLCYNFFPLMWYSCCWNVIFSRNFLSSRVLDQILMQIPNSNLQGQKETSYARTWQLQVLYLWGTVIPRQL